MSTVSDVSAVAESRRERKRRRQCGITVRNVVRTAMRLKKAGELEDASREEIAAIVLTEIVSENRDVVFASSDPTIDLDKWLAFIEALMPLIEMLIALFGGP